MERDKRQEDPGMGARGPQVWRAGHWVAQHTVQRTMYCMDVLRTPFGTRPRVPPFLTRHTTYCLRKVYVRTYETTSCVSGPSSKEPSPGHPLPGTGHWGEAGGNGVPRRGIDRSTRGKDCERGKSTRVSCGSRPITSVHLLLCLPGTYLFPTWQGGVDETWSWPVST